MLAQDIVGQALNLARKTKRLKRVFQIAVIAFFCVLTFVTRCHNLRDVFIRGHIYFVDPDCYSRMTRVRMITEHQGAIIKHQTFENWPKGVNSHATAPLDYLILGLAKVVSWTLRIADWRGSSVLKEQTLDVAGALISPLIGVAGALSLAAWAWAVRLRFWSMPLLLYAVSPILVHGTLLGRPDHQSLLMLTVMVALGAEIALANGGEEGARVPLRTWGLVSGIAWAVSLWVSLYEPLILLGIVLSLWLAFDRRALCARARLPGAAAFVLILAAALLIEGWRIERPDAVMLQYFPNWQRTIGELSHLDLRSALLYHWLGWTVATAPFLMLWIRKTDRQLAPMLILLTCAVALTVWQVRWGYFLAIIFVLVLPWQMPALRRPWIAWLVFLISLWPVAQEWDGELFPDEPMKEHDSIQRAEKVRLREVVLPMAGEGPFLAPWWLSPSIAYWTEDPGVAGSSHEGLSGIVDSARFFLADNADDAGTILRAREVRWVLADDASRVIGTSAIILGVAPPAKTMARILAENAGEAPPFLHEMLQRRPQMPQYGAPLKFDDPSSALEAMPDWMTFYRVYSVDDAKLPR